MPDTARAKTVEEKTWPITCWRPTLGSSVDGHAQNTIPLVTRADVSPIVAGLDFWDLWPIQTADGRTAQFDGGEIWMILSAPYAPDPNARHDVARIRLLFLNEQGWRDLGNFMPDGMCPGKREWAGSAVFDPETSRVTLFYTVAGRRNDKGVTFEQRLFEVSARFTWVADQAVFDDWVAPRESIKSDGAFYEVVDGHNCEPGFIKGFRDPAHFCDPADGSEYLVFTASIANSPERHNGAIGLAKRAGQGWQVLPPLLDADGYNNELERPHVIAHNGLYYLFWSTQRHMFADAATAGATGLYGAVAEAVLGPYRPLNATGLVAANPASESRQTYSWWVDAELCVHGFVDIWGLEGRDPTGSTDLLRAQFGGVPAPVFKLNLSGDVASISAGCQKSGKYKRL